MLQQSYHLTNRLHDWRERRYEAAALELQQLAADLVADINAEIALLPDRVLLLKQVGYIKRKVVREIDAAAKATMERHVAKANEELRLLVEEMLAWQSSQADHRDAETLRALGDVASVAAPIAEGLAGAASLSGPAVTASAEILGLGVVPTLSWPAVIVGGTVASGLLATGAIKTSPFAARTRSRLLEASRKTIVAHLLTGTKPPSLLRQYGDMLDRTVENALGLDRT